MKYQPGTSMLRSSVATVIFEYKCTTLSVEIWEHFLFNQQFRRFRNGDHGTEISWEMFQKIQGL